MSLLWRASARVRPRPRALRRLVACPFWTPHAMPVPPKTTCRGSVRVVHIDRAKGETVEPVLDGAAARETSKKSVATREAATERTSDLLHRVVDTKTTYQVALRAFNTLRSRGLKLEESLYLSLLYKALREGRFERVWDGYSEFLDDERKRQVQEKPRAPTTWPSVTSRRMQMHRFVLWAMLDANRQQEMAPFYRSEVVGKCNMAGIHEADSFNFLLRLECTTRVMDETDDGLRRRVDSLLHAMERLALRTSYSSTHSLVRLILHRPEIFFAAPTDRQQGESDEEAAPDTGYTAKAMGDLILEYMDRFPRALSLDPKRLSIAVSAAAAAGRHDAAKMLLQHGVRHHVPIDAGSFAHAVESAPDDAGRMEIADLYVHAKEQECIYTAQDTDGSIVNYLLLYAILDGNFKHMMELLHEMQLCNNRSSNRTIGELFKSIAQYRAEIQRGKSKAGTDKKLGKCPTIMELFQKFPNVIPYTTYSLSQGILQSLHAGDLAIALELMHAAVRRKGVKLRPEIYSQLLYPLLASRQREGDEASDVSIFDRLEVERCFDEQYPNQRVHLNSLIVNICESNEDISTMLVCLDRWQEQGHAPMSRRVTNRVFDVISKQVQQFRKQHHAATPRTAFVLDGLQLSHEAFLVRYRSIITWDAWTFGRAIVRARTCGLHADVIALLAQATSQGLVLNAVAYVVSLCVLEEVGDKCAILACVETMKVNNVWTKAVEKYPSAQKVLDRAIGAGQLDESTD
ncbi:unnamed protein product [Hyaloperonospora brassicae]|uniref:Pentacotripeptide-repeat region of PRORP domain-containing protein n=1 Tax=Hyaloperonospora brassicae TaxID=162125 RepID=A0AAV0SY41_HYABA|nr:unnamed protein product [Hyaloperonospora brassicae]